MRRMIALVILALCVSGLSRAATIQVPGDQPTIAAGLALAVEGDTVLVAEGNYFERDLLMPSGVTLRGATGVPQDVVIEGSYRSRVMVVSGCDASTRIEAVTFMAGQAAPGGPFGSHGGGIYCVSSQARITRCLFQTNNADDGGGMECLDSSPVLTECWFEENAADNGGGVYLRSSNAEFHACRFYKNVALLDGGGAFLNASAPILEDCVLFNNRARCWGGGIYAQGATAPHLLGCTFVENQTTLSWGSAIFTCGDCEPLIENTVVALNSGDGAINAYDPQSLPALFCCDVFGNVGGNYGGVLGDQTGIQGNISADPHFCDPSDRNFTLWDDSPCLPENNECQVLMGALPQGCGGGMDVPAQPSALRASCRLSNPYVAGSTIEFSLPPDARASLSLYDAQGRCIREFTQLERGGAASASLCWDGRDRSGARLPAGPYFYRLWAPPASVMGRIQLVY